MQILQQVLEILNYVSANIPWDAVAASGVLSPLLVGVKRWFSVQSERIMISLVILFAMLAAAGNYLLNVPSQDPGVIAVQGAVLAFMTQPVYFFVVKPAYKWFSGQLAKAAAFDEQVKANTEPVPVPSAAAASLAPVEPAVPARAIPVTDDFSQ